jgi:hypothetical protein
MLYSILEHIISIIEKVIELIYLMDALEFHDYIKNGSMRIYHEIGKQPLLFIDPMR